MNKKEENQTRKSNGLLVTILVVALLVSFASLGYALGAMKTAESLKKEIDKIEEKNKNEKEETERTVNTLSEEEALKLGNERWQFAYKTYWEGNCEYSIDEIKENYADDVSLTAPEPMNSYTMEEYIGQTNSGCAGAGRGGLQDYKETNLKVDKITENEITFIATSEFCGGSFCHEAQETVKTVEKPFVIKKVNGKWVIQSFYLPN